MIERKKKLRITQLTLLLFGIFIIYITYYSKRPNLDNELLSKTTKEKVEQQKITENEDQPDLFFNVEYTGLDLNGNRYLLKSEEAYLDEKKPEIVFMKKVQANFYFKDGTNLNVWSEKGIYNNKNLDMIFEANVKAEYEGTDLFAERAEYSNTKSYLSISEDVKVDDIRGNLVADKLLFDITKKKLNITSFNNGKINANVNLNEKRF